VNPAPAARSPLALAALVVGALGVVFGDIGTSPLYAFREVFHAGGVPVTPAKVLGVLSLIFWTLTVVVALKYVLLILRADHHGEGGLIALMALAIAAVSGRPRLRRGLLLLGMFGTAVFYGDAIITPAISVLSAVEGLEVAAPALGGYVVPVTVLVLTLLFAVQRLGTGGIGRWFGPVTLVWFVALIALGLPQLLAQPQVLAALNPLHALDFVVAHPLVAFVALGAIVLTVTGAEALYADLGHFGRRPIRLAWYTLVMPALVVNYFGQGALLLAQPQAVDNPFYRLAPQWALLPLVLLATAATVIASQALITAAFSVTRQAIQLGLLPRMRVLHTSVRTAGQIYLPFVNWSLYVAVVLAVVLFGSSTNLAAAYGVAVTLDMTITTVMTFFVLRHAWRRPLALCMAATGFFLCIDLLFFASNLLKLPAGGWFPLLIGVGLFVLMLTWLQGRERMSERLRADAIDLRGFLDAVFVAPPVRVPGTAVFLGAEAGLAPNALMHNLKHNQVLHEYNLFVTVRHHELPWIGFDKRIEMQPLGHDCWQLTLHYGYKNDPDVPAALALLRDRGVPLDEMRTSYFLSHDVVVPPPAGVMSAWRAQLFAVMHRNAARAADFMSLPPTRVVELGARIPL
jgi:KUP system potassium uptake protein